MAVQNTKTTVAEHLEALRAEHRRLMGVQNEVEAREVIASALTTAIYGLELIDSRLAAVEAALAVLELGGEDSNGGQS